MSQLTEKTVSLKEVFRLQNANWIISVSHKACILLCIASVAAIIVRWNHLPPQVPLWYAKPWGNERLAMPFWLFMLPVGSFIWHSINTVTALFITRDYLVFTQLLLISSLIVNLLSFITLTKILLIIS